MPYTCRADSGQFVVSAAGKRFNCRMGTKPAKSKVPSCICVTGMARGRSSPVRTSVNADRAEHTVASGAWNGGLMDEIMEGVKTSTLGLVGVSPGGVIRDVKRGKND